MNDTSLISTRWKDIYTHLKEKGFKVYSPGQAKGDCLSNYIVIKNSSNIQYLGLSSTRALYELLCYCPADNYSGLEVFITRVKNAMTGLYPMVIPTHSELPPFYDDTVKAYMVSIEYRTHRNYKRNY